MIITSYVIHCVTNYAIEPLNTYYIRCSGFINSVSIDVIFMFKVNEIQLRDGHSMSTLLSKMLLKIGCKSWLDSRRQHLSICRRCSTFQRKKARH